MCFGDGGKGTLQDWLKTLIPQDIAKQNEALDPLTSYATNMLNVGLPEFNQVKDFSSGTVAQNSAPARNAIIRNLSGAGLKMTDPAAQSVLAGFEGDRARAYDQNMLNLLNLKQQGRQTAASNLASVGAARSPYPYLSLFGSSINA